MAGSYDGRLRICLPDTLNINSKGYFKGDDPLAYVFPVMMIQLIMFFFISRGIYFILKPLRQPVFVSNVLAGIIMGPSFLGFNKSLRDKFYPPKEMVVLNSLSALGGTLFVFITAVKMDGAGILKLAKKAINVGIPCLFVTFIFTFSISLRLRKNIPGMAGGIFPFVLSLILSLNYFPVVAHVLSELDQLTSDLGQLAMSCTMLNEIISMLLVAVTPALVGGDKTVIFKSEMGVLVLLITAIFVLRPAVHWIIKTTPEGKPVKEIYIVGLLMGALLMGAWTDFIGKTLMMGVVLMGLVIPPGPPLGLQIINRFELVLTHFFLPFFYIRIGQFTNVSSIKNWSGLISFEIIMGGSYLGKMIGSLLSVLFIKTSIRNALVLGCILNLKGIIDLILFFRLRLKKSIDEQTFTLVVLTHTAITAVLTPLVSIYYNPNNRKLAATPSMEGRMRTLGTTPVNSELRVLCCIHNEDSVHGLITLLKAFNPCKMSPICAYPVHLVELVGRATPLLVPYKTNKRKIKENSTDRIIRAMEKFSKASQVAIQPFTLIAPYKTMYESISNLVQDKFVSFIILPFNQIQQGGGGGGTANLRIFNRKIQNHAPCTVGLFVDRGLPRYLSSNYFSYNTAVYFLGGADDREVMSLVSRMSGNPDISITLFRIHELLEAGEDDSERLLDDEVINEFKSTNLGNACVACHDVEVTNTTEVMEAMRSSENDYDLVVVGKRRRPKSKLEIEMMPWADYPELGVIGDMLASQDFCGGMIPVLVIQCVTGINGSSSIIGDTTSDGRMSHVSYPFSRLDSDLSGSMRNDGRI